MEKDHAASWSEYIASDVWVPAAIDEVWNYFSNPQNLNELTPASYGIKVLPQGPTSNGTKVKIQFSLLGLLPLPLSWTSELNEVVPEGKKRKFIDTQTQGPFPYWRHEHLFEEGVSEITGSLSGQKMLIEPNGTWIRDRIFWTPPLASIGWLGIKSKIASNLTSLLNYRRQKIQELFKK